MGFGLSFEVGNNVRMGGGDVAVLSRILREIEQQRRVLFATW
jgi:hypothetical protein